MDSGHLPHLSRLAEEGGFMPLESPIPAQTPVSWSTFATGLDPGEHRVFNFLQRRPGTYIPEFAGWGRQSEPFARGKKALFLGVTVGLFVLVFGFLALRIVRRAGMVWVSVVALAAGMGSAFIQYVRLPEFRPVFSNHQTGATFWERLGEAGIRVQLFRMPVSFPARSFPKGRLLTGLGTPDLSLRVGKPFYFTSELFFSPFSGAESPVEVVELSGDKGILETEITGPINPWRNGETEPLGIPLTLEVSPNRETLTLNWNQQRLELRPGDWSQEVAFSFSTGIPSRNLVGLGRFKLLELAEDIRLYLSPLHMDHGQVPPEMPISYPLDHAQALRRDFGPFKTSGWPHDTWSPGEGTLDLKSFLEDVTHTRKAYEAVLYGALEARDWDLLFHYFEFTDRVQHLLWRSFDEIHPGHDREEAQQFAQAIPGVYREMDRIVGQTVKRLQPEDILLVVSDHGFTSFRRTMSYNAWLARAGYLRMKGEGPNREGLDLLLGQGSFFRGVDWSRTQAYALGMGQIYINLAGREKQGIVQPGEEYEALCRDIAARLTEHIDPKTGLNPVKRVVLRDQIYRQFQADLVPDLLPLNDLGYRVGWDDSLGGIPRKVHEDNLRLWSGDHATVDPALLPGILVGNRGLSGSPANLAGPTANMEDLAPTLLALFGVTHPLPGRSLVRP